jgi:hypothetical protein
LRRSSEQREIDKRVLEFTIDLFKIIFMKNIPINEKYEILVMHIVENKVWFCYFLGVVAIISILLATSL